MDSGWLTLIYQYTVGGIIFGAGAWVVLKTGACDMKNPKERQWFYWLLGGFGFMFSLHFLWTLAAYYL